MFFWNICLALFHYNNLERKSFIDKSQTAINSRKKIIEKLSMTFLKDRFKFYSSIITALLFNIVKRIYLDHVQKNHNMRMLPISEMCVYSNNNKAYFLLDSLSPRLITRLKIRKYKVFDKFITILQLFVWIKS